MFKEQLSWSNVSVSANHRPLLQAVSGSVSAGGITAIIGPKASGKSVLLSVLSGEPHPEIRVKGKLKTVTFTGAYETYPLNQRLPYLYKQSISFLSARNIATLDYTPREMIKFHVSLRMPYIPINNYTDSIVSLLRLEKCENLEISDLTVSEKMRTLIAIELVKTPQVLILDDPLKGMDVYDSYQVIQVLKQISRDRDLSILLSASFVSSEVFFLFDQVQFLTRGSIVYGGEPDKMSEYFKQNNGYSCPVNHSPLDYVLLLMQTIEFNEHRRLVENWQWMKSIKNRVTSDETVTSDIVVTSVKDLYKTSSLYRLGFNRPDIKIQFRALVRREVFHLYRNYDGLLLKLSLTAFISLLVGCFFYKVGSLDIYYNTDDLQTYTSAMCFVLLAGLFGQVESVAASIPFQRAKFQIEYSNNLYGSLMFFIAQMVVEIPVILITSLVHLSICYTFIQLQGGFLYWWMNVFAVSICTTSYGWLISCFSKSAMTAMQVLPLVFLPQILFSGVIVDIIYVPSGVSWIQYFCYLKYINDLMFLNEYSAYINSSEAVSKYATSNNINNLDSRIYGAIVAGIIVGSRFVASFALSRKTKEAYNG
jgi:ABC-type multidrug transport system ATPase subunit/ABC-type multidrug transport system permease subunit